MQISRNDRVRIERAHVLAWPASRTADIDGWLWRSSGGGSQRANSVSTLDFIGPDVQAAIAAVEARYRAVGAPARFHVFDETSPSGLSDLLRLRGYRQSSATVTMIKANTQDFFPAAGVEHRSVEHHDTATDAWLDVYLDAITQDRRAVNASIIGNIPRPSRYFLLRRGGRVLSTALCVVGFKCAVIECVATRAEARRQGAARDLLSELQRWAARQQADLIGLQVADDNRPAIALYRDFGFCAAATNWFWSLDAP